MIGRRAIAGAGVVAAFLLACTSGDETATSDVPTTDYPDAAPGVTDDAVEVGVTYVDSAPLVDVGLDFQLGDYPAITERWPTRSTTRAASGVETVDQRADHELELDRRVRPAGRTGPGRQRSRQGDARAASPSVPGPSFRVYRSRGRRTCVGNSSIATKYDPSSVRG